MLLPATWRQRRTDIFFHIKSEILYYVRILTKGRFKILRTVQGWHLKGISENFLARKVQS